MEDLDQNDEDLLSFFDKDDTKEGYDSAEEILDFLDNAADKAKQKDSGKQSKDGGNTCISVKETKLNRQKPAPPNGSVVGTKKTGKEYNFNGITISEPKISLPILNHRVDGRKLVKISRIESTMVNSDIEGDWVTIAVLVRKVTQKKSSSGKNFSVWHLSDMGTGTENLTVGFFLFGDVYKEHWKLQVGTIVGLLNPSIMKQEKDSWNQLSITIDNPKKLMEIGISRDLGVCKGVRKSDNKPCCMFINKNYGDYCEYHVQKQFKKAKHQRTELQSGGVGPEIKGRHKGNLMHNIKRDISQGNVYYGGRTVFLGQQKNQPVKIESSRQKKNVAPKNRNPIQSRNFNDQDIGMKETQLVGGTKDFKQLLDCPTVGSRNLLHLLKGNQIKEEETTVPKPNVKSAKDFLFKNKSELLTPKVDIVSSKCKDETVGKPEQKMHKEVNRVRKAETNKPENQQIIQPNKKVFDINFLEVRSKERDTVKNSTKTDTENTPDTAKSKFVPKLGRGFSRNDDLFIASDEDDDLNYNVYTGAEEKSQTKLVTDKMKDNIVEEKKAVPKVPTALSDAKKKAIALIKQQGQIQKEDPNEVPGKCKKRKSDVTMERVERSRKEDETERPFAKKKKGLLANVLGEIDINSSEGKKILNQKSRNMGELQLVEAEREERYFNSLERKEQMENKMSQIFEIKVKGVACKICGYLSDSRSKFCIDEQHHVAHIPNVIKKFFKCKHCQNRCYSFNRPMPKEPCRRCGERDFVKAPMGDERKGPKLGAETLLLRGEERKYINSLY